jgi:hypothetical protein
MELECAKLKVKVNKVGNLDNFNQALSRVKAERRKAEDVILDDIESDVIQKARFLEDQVTSLREMSENLNTLIESKRVITVVS